MNTAGLELWLHRHTGLDASTLGAGVLARAAEERLAALACRSVEDYVAILETAAGERQALIERIVVPETWFFRDQPAFDALVRHATSAWSTAHPAETLRILSVPCSTGEEPYSIVMALALAGWPLERLRVDAIDISREALAKAARGEYRRNSFRGAELAYREAFFERRGDAWRLADRICRAVHFTLGNLLAPEMAAGGERYHAVFCRNLLIYFDEESRRRAARVLQERLEPEGWLLVGPAESVPLFELGFEAVPGAPAFVLRKAAARPPAVRPRARPASVAEPRSAPRERLPAVRALPKPAAPPRSDPLAEIRALADAGQLREAARRGAELLARGHRSTELLYLLALIDDAAGDLERAEMLYRKVLYLDPQHADALLHLALVAEKRGAAGDARRLRERARRSAAGGAA